MYCLMAGTGSPPQAAATQGASEQRSSRGGGEGRHGRRCGMSRVIEPDNVVVPPADVRVWSTHAMPATAGMAEGGQASAHTPFVRVRPLFTRLRRLIAAQRFRSQAWFFSTPR